MLVTQKIVPQWRGMKQRLQHWVHKTSVTHIIKAPETPWEVRIRLGKTSHRTRLFLNQSFLLRIRYPRSVFQPTPLPQVLCRMWRRRTWNGTDRGGGRLCENHTNIKLSVVNLVIAETTEELCAVDVHRYGMVGSIIIAFCYRKLRSMRKSMEVAEDGGASHAYKEPRRRVLTRATVEDLSRRFATDGCAAQRANLKTILEVPKGMRAKFRSEFKQVLTRIIRNLANIIGIKVWRRNGGTLLVGLSLEGRLMKDHMVSMTLTWRLGWRWHWKKKWKEDSGVG